jgi:tetratricopeptide (TPR) repeat protein
LLTDAADRCEPWLKRLEAVDKTPLRMVALRAQVAQTLDPQADVEAIIEPKLAEQVAAAQSAMDKQKLYRVAGDLYVGLKRYAAAEKWYRLLTTEAPQQYAVVVNALARQGRLSEAVELCQQVAQKDQTVQPALVLAEVLVRGQARESDFAAAEPILAGALTKFPNHAELHYAVALVRVVQKKEDDSIALFRRVVKFKPRSVEALNNLAMMLAERPNDRAEALRLIDDAIAIAGKDPGLLDTKGAILLYGGRSSEAVPFLESAIREIQADPRHHFHLAVAYRDLGKTEQAKSQLKTALDRRLGELVLTPTDQKLLGELRAALQL